LPCSPVRCSCSHFRTIYQAKQSSDVAVFFGQGAETYAGRAPHKRRARHDIQTPDRCFTVFRYEHGQPNDRLCKRSTYAGRLQYLTEHLTKNERVSFGRIFLENRKIVGDRCLHISLRYYTYIYIFYFSNPEHTHKISTCKNSKSAIRITHYIPATSTTICNITEL